MFLSVESLIPNEENKVLFGNVIMPQDKNSVLNNFNLQLEDFY